LYLIVGLPGETTEDLKEFADLTKEIAKFVSLTVSAGPLIPKKHTGLAGARAWNRPEIRRKYKELRKIMPKNVHLSLASPREAVKEARLAALNLPGLREIEESTG
jgi:radical SAM superfamily enzyme YgiQ (UPF0313 family)